jgi:hypothetical protein
MTAMSSDPAAAGVLRESATRLGQFGDAFVRQLHADLGPLTVDLAGGGWAFCDRMVRTLLWIPVTDQPPQAIVSTLQWVGRQNWMDGFPDERYTDVAHAVVQTIRTLMSDQWSTPMGSAWVGCFLWIRPHMIAGARQAASPPIEDEGESIEDTMPGAARPPRSR